MNGDLQKIGSIGYIRTFVSAQTQYENDKKKIDMTGQTQP